jgi:ribosomal protein S18 acetylase RimI-like enzyme
MAYSTLLSAFTNDPVERWLYPDDYSYLAHFPRFLAALGGKAFGDATAWSVGDCDGVALWLRPGTEPDGDAIGQVLTETVSVDKHDEMFAVLDQMDEHHPSTQHWYLPWFGVGDSLQGRGVGGELMGHCLEIVGQGQLPAYLESPNPRNISFYERHGFVVVGQTQASTCPPITFMSRAAT